MHARDTDAIPLPPRPDIDQYRKRAKGLVDVVGAVDSGDASAVSGWAKTWLTSLAKHVREQGIDEAWIEREAERLVTEVAERKVNTLADAQLYVAHIHGFD